MATRSAMDYRVRFSGRSPRFFKVFVPHTSSQRLRFPPKFGHGIDGDDFSAMVSLKGPSGRYWLITLTKKSNVCFFDDGWNEFVADHSLEFGDILVFRYLGESRFRVIVFDSTCCEKDKAFTARNGNVGVSLKRKMGSDGGVVSEGPLRKKRSATVTKKHPCCFHNCSITRRRVNPGSRTVEDGLNSPSTVGHSSPSPSKPHRGHPRKVIQMNDDSSLFKTSEEETSDRPTKTVNRAKLFETPEEPTTSNRQAKTVNKAKSKTRSGQVEDGLNSPSSPSPSKPHRGHPRKVIQIKDDSSLFKTSEEETSDRPTKTVNRAKLFETREEPTTSNRQARTVNKAKSKTRSGQGGTKEQNEDTAYERSKSFKSRHPFFKKVMTDGYVESGFCLAPPSCFSREYLSDGRTEMTLLDEDGKSWEIKYNYRGKYGTFGKGWRKFARHHHLKVGDLCFFELINKYQLRVHFFR